MNSRSREKGRNMHLHLEAHFPGYLSRKNITCHKTWRGKHSVLLHQDPALHRAPLQVYGPNDLCLSAREL